MPVAAPENKRKLSNNSIQFGGRVGVVVGLGQMSHVGPSVSMFVNGLKQFLSCLMLFCPPPRWSRDCVWPLFILSDWAVYLCFTWKRETLCPFIIILSIALFRRVERSPRRTTRKRRKLNIPSPLPWQWLLFTLELRWWSGRKYLLLASLSATSSNSLSQARSGPRSAGGRRVSNGKLWREELWNVNILTSVILSPSHVNCFTHVECCTTQHQETVPTVSPDGDNSYNPGCTWPCWPPSHTTTSCSLS